MHLGTDRDLLSALKDGRRLGSIERIYIMNKKQSKIAENYFSISNSLSSIFEYNNMF